ncbi:hypothetical protein AB838_06230 [Rhodobacteraceae bacterium (ex Bugula neritina AB1)]|nr:hypothetical protein AB838_06230 [Rhodobacteraceae bacterium (ex Bugula neritina AB1)]
MAQAVRLACANRHANCQMEVFSLRGLSDAEAGLCISGMPSHAIVIDFTHEAALHRLLELSSSAPFSLITGTSGLHPEHYALLRQRAEHSAVLSVGNFSMGALLAKAQIELAASFAQKLGGWEAAVVDLHHSEKADSPSATAISWRDAWESRVEDSAAPISSLRMGDGVSEHLFVAAGAGERIEVTHRLLNRSSSAAGVMIGIGFIQSCPAGLYHEDSLINFVMQRESDEA